MENIFIKNKFRDKIKTIIGKVISMELRDYYEIEHSIRVANLARDFAHYLNLPLSITKEVYLAGLLHDVGKIRMPLEILSKPGSLTEEEYEIIKKHSTVGGEILDKNILGPIIDVVVHHHERYDGSGYPDGLKGEEISLSTRIISLIDSFDAMTSQRVYNTKKDLKEAIDDLYKSITPKEFGGKGVRYDPKLTRKFIDWLLIK